jgi:hypothetical protein
MALTEIQQLRMLERLRSAGEQPVTLDQLRAGGIDFPAVVIGELELNGYVIERVYEHSRQIGVRCWRATLPIHPLHAGTSGGAEFRDSHLLIPHSRRERDSPLRVSGSSRLDVSDRAGGDPTPRRLRIGPTAVRDLVLGTRPASPGRRGSRRSWASGFRAGRSRPGVPADTPRRHPLSTSTRRSVCRANPQTPRPGRPPPPPSLRALAVLRVRDSITVLMTSCLQIDLFGRVCKIASVCRQSVCTTVPREALP